LGREFAPAGLWTRPKDAAVQIARISETDPIRPCCSPERVQRATPSRFPQRAPRSQRRSVSALASGDCGLEQKSRALRFSFGQSQVHVTTRSELCRNVGARTKLVLAGLRHRIACATPTDPPVILPAWRYVSALTRDPAGASVMRACHGLNRVIRPLLTAIAG
jgi:hypothetical protein